MYSNEYENSATAEECMRNAGALAIKIRFDRAEVGFEKSRGAFLSSERHVIEAIAIALQSNTARSRFVSQQDISSELDSNRLQ